MKLFFCHGLEGSPSGRKAQTLRAAGHQVTAPELPRESFEAGLQAAETALREAQVDAIVGSSRGGAIAMVLARAQLMPLILLAPAWRRCQVEPIIEPDTRIIHGIKDDVVPLEDSILLEESNGLPAGNLIPVNDDHRLSGSLGLSALLRAVADLDQTPVRRQPALPAGNQIFAIKPYLFEGVWVFDDPERGLIKEALVAGMPEMIELATRQAGIPHPERGFVALFSKDPFPGAQIALEWVREEMGGNVYRWPEADREGWLCPALFRYFTGAPRRLHLSVQAAR